MVNRHNYYHLPGQGFPLRSSSPLWIPVSVKHSLYSLTQTVESPYPGQRLAKTYGGNCVDVFVCMCVHVLCRCVFVRVYVCACVYMFVNVCECAYGMCMHLCIGVCVCLHVFSVQVHACVYMCMYTCVHVCRCVRVYACVNVYTCSMSVRMSV